MVLGSVVAGVMGASVAHAAPSLTAPTTPTSVIHVSHQAIPSSQCDLLLKHGYSKDACVVTITGKTILTQVQPASGGNTPYYLGGGCGNTYSVQNYMDANDGPIWGGEVHTWFDYSSCSVWATNATCYSLYYVPGTTVATSSCTHGTSGSSGYGSGTFDIAVFGVHATERMEVTVSLPDALSPSYDCYKQPC